ncbi:MAG: Undecaprenyl-phosphate 4-deoxy-4-formamido-L-arabinose transferase [Anaerolineales bacterium]|nr:Undecaprenyl-phosphate 4-deoxy-4-formamido-L-arabinose transferase [Anaerolineales bacterium]
MNSPSFDSAGQTYQQTRMTHWDAVARQRDRWTGLGGAYHKRLAEIYRFLVSPGQRVLEIGSGLGNLIGAVEPSRGVGVDFSSEMVVRATALHPEIKFVHADAHDLSFLHETFDVIILSDLVNDAWDVQRILEQIRPLCAPSTRVIVNFYSRLWQLTLSLAQQTRLATKMLDQNWFTPDDVRGMLNLAGFESIRGWTEVLFPLPIPLLQPFCDRFLARLPFFRELALSNFVVARPTPLRLPPFSAKMGGVSRRDEGGQQPVVSVIVPARNESGNIKAIFERTPKMGRKTEIVFVEGHSTDDTFLAIEREIASHPSTPSLLLRQPGIGKGDAMRAGYDAAHGDVLMILDADLTVPPEDLPRFYDALVSGKGEFINGVRLVYPMEKEAMRVLNFFGNKFFSMAFTSLLGQPVKDTLCGTKVLWKKDYNRIAANRAYFGDFDPFGDFDLIFGAAKLNLKIVDLPIRYRERTYGSTNISRWKHGMLLLRMVWYAARRIKFI